MKILAIDTSTKLCSISLLYKKNIQNYFKFCPLNHNKYILHMIHKLLSINNIQIKKINTILYSKGPGSFTGIRIGLGITQGLSMQYNIPTFGISTLEIIAQRTWTKYKIKKIISFLDAQLNHVYCGVYKIKKNKRLIKIKAESNININMISSYLYSLKGLWIMSGQNIIKKYSIILNKKTKFIQSSIKLPSTESMIYLYKQYVKYKKKNNNFKLTY